MKQSVALVWLAVCGLILHIATGLYVPDEFDDALRFMSQHDVTLKDYINNRASRWELQSALANARTQHDLLKTLGKEKVHNGELALLKRALVQAFEELTQEIKNALGITDDGARAIRRRISYK